jgi:Putative zincin peptidase
MMLSKGAFYATADNALFWRNDFIFIALAPLIGITLLGLLLVYLLPDTIGYYVSLGVVFNAANSIGDLWMTAVVRRYPPTTLVRDQADSIRIYVNS